MFVSENIINFKLAAASFFVSILFMKKRYRYFCANCEEEFFTERLNMNERHHCGAFGRLDWKDDWKDNEEKE